MGNALFSFLSGSYLFLFSDFFTKVILVGNSPLYQTIGGVLMAFGLLVFTQALKPRHTMVLFIIFQDMLWVLGSAFLLIFRPFDISGTGLLIMALVALVVLSFAILQYLGLAQYDDLTPEGRKRLVYQRTINADKEMVWKVVSDVSNYHRVAPNIDAVEIISGQGEGLVRSCTHGSASWTEVATLWEEGEQYSFQVRTEAKDYPFPLSHLTGNWKVEEVSEAMTKITMTFEFEYEMKIKKFLLHPLMKPQFGRICKALLDNWQNELEK